MPSWAAFIAEMWARRGTPCNPIMCMPKAMNIIPVNHHHTPARAVRGRQPLHRQRTGRKT